uniref:Uncharacterized protein n=1 Tax=Octactis speculum TaxID=3111310 RepID=A0A7S2B461_9STRA|mmetsp:Transcript_18725/g.25382  ORF Transcript_18725/g.25382 Transcript_18725/m.25382 type:complete len:125 (+) Transcript_18725:109-483(+)
MLVTKSSALEALRTYGSERPKNVHEFHSVLRKVVPLEKQAPRKLQAQFALLSTVPSPFATPLIIGGTLANWDTGNRSAMIEECPEIKMIFPALHDSACFGAKSSLDKEACYASLCVTNPKPSGC